MPRQRDNKQNMEELVCKYQNNHIAITQPEGKITPCCHFNNNPNPHWDDVNLNTLTTLNDIHSTYRWYDLRETLREGVQYTGCENCWMAEEYGYKSKREFYNLLESGNDLEDLEVAFDFSCNFMCRTCRPGVSSTWDKVDVSTLKEFEKDHYEPLKNDNYRDKFKKLIENTDLSKLKRLSVVGGEPFLSPTFEWFLKRIPQKLQIKITTNGSIFPSDKLLSLLNKHDVFLDISIDAVEELAEVMRYGASWNTVDGNIKKFLETDWFVKFCCLVSIMNVNRLTSVVKYARQHDVPVVPYFMNWPYHLRSNILPLDMRKEWEIKLPKKLTTIKFMGIEESHDDVKEFNNVILNESQSENKLLEFVKTMKLLDDVQEKRFWEWNPEIWAIAHTCDKVKEYYDI